MLFTASNEIIDALKVALRSRGITYRELGDKLGVSEKTVKRLFSDKDCSLSRLDDICSAINLSLFDLIDFARQYKEPPATMSPEQESFLSNKRSHFNFLFLLTVGYTAQQIQERYELSEISLFRYLRDLDKHKFIELGANNHYKLLIKGKLLLKLHGPLHDTISSSNESFAKFVIENEDKPDVSFLSAYRFISKDTLVELNSELNELSNKYRKLATRDEAILHRDKLVGVKWALYSAPFEIFGQWGIEEYKE